jgi:hypothetical protein
MVFLSRPSKRRRPVPRISFTRRIRVSWTSAKVDKVTNIIAANFGLIVAQSLVSIAENVTVLLNEEIVKSDWHGLSQLDRMRGHAARVQWFLGCPSPG